MSYSYYDLQLLKFVDSNIGIYFKMDLSFNDLSGSISSKLLKLPNVWKIDLSARVKYLIVPSNRRSEASEEDWMLWSTFDLIFYFSCHNKKRVSGCYGQQQCLAQSLQNFILIVRIALSLRLNKILQ